MKVPVGFFPVFCQTHFVFNQNSSSNKDSVWSRVACPLLDQARSAACLCIYRARFIEERRSLVSWSEAKSRLLGLGGDTRTPPSSSLPVCDSSGMQTLDHQPFIRLQVFFHHECDFQPSCHPPPSQPTCHCQIPLPEPWL